MSDEELRAMIEEFDKDGDGESESGDHWNSCRIGVVERDLLGACR